MKTIYYFFLKCLLQLSYRDKKNNKKNDKMSD